MAFLRRMENRIMRMEAILFQRDYQLLYALLGSLVILVGMWLRLSGWVYATEWWWYVSSSLHVVDGTFAIYRHLGAEWTAPPLGSTSPYPPLIALILAPFLLVAQQFGLSQREMGDVIVLPLLIMVALTADRFALLVRTIRPARRELVVFVSVLWMLTIGKMVSVAAYENHHDPLVLLTLLAGLRLLPDKPLFAGVFFGLSLEAKQTAVLAVFPILCVACLHFWSGERLHIIKLLMGLLLGFFPLLVPFYILHPSEAYYGLFVQESLRVLHGPSMLHYADNVLQLIDPATYSSNHRLLLKLANPILIIVDFVMVVGLLFARRIDIHSPQMYALIALSAMTQLLLGKWVEPMHYYAVPLALLLLWELMKSPRRIPWFSLGAMLVVTASSLDPTNPQGPNNPGLLAYHTLQAIPIVCTAVLAASILKTPKMQMSRELWPPGPIRIA